jgi:hypothetical protein
LYLLSFRLLFIKKLALALGEDGLFFVNNLVGDVLANCFINPPSCRARVALFALNLIPAANAGNCFLAYFCLEDNRFVL